MAKRELSLSSVPPSTSSSSSKRVKQEASPSTDVKPKVEKDIKPKIEQDVKPKVEQEAKPSLSVIKDVPDDWFDHADLDLLQKLLLQACDVFRARLPRLLVRRRLHLPHQRRWTRQGLQDRILRRHRSPGSLVRRGILAGHRRGYEEVREGSQVGEFGVDEAECFERDLQRLGNLDKWVNRPRLRSLYGEEGRDVGANDWDKASEDGSGSEEGEDQVEEEEGEEEEEDAEGETDEEED